MFRIIILGVQSREFNEVCSKMLKGQNLKLLTKELAPKLRELPLPEVSVQYGWRINNAFFGNVARLDLIIQKPKSVTVTKEAETTIKTIIKSLIIEKASNMAANCGHPPPSITAKIKTYDASN